MDGFTYNGIHSYDMGCYYIPDASALWFASPNFERNNSKVSWRHGE